MKFLLTTLNAKYIHTNLAIRLLYELNANNQDLNWKEFTIKENPDDVAKECSQYSVVAFSCYIWNIKPTLLVARKIKAINPNTTILLGGPEVSYENDDLILRDEVDFIITGEGEIPFQEFLNSYPNVFEIPSLVYKTNGQITKNRCSPNFDVLKFEELMPYRTDQLESLQNKVLYIETSRGCPYKCEFCLASLDNKVRYLPQKHIDNTLLFLMNHGKVIKFLDRTFNVKKDFTLRIFDFILKHHKPGNVFQFEITADILHPDIIAYIQQKVPKGLFRFEIGIQTVNQKANLEVSRKQNFNKTKEIIQSLSAYVEMHLDLIVGLPLDYWEDIKYSFEEVFLLHAPELQLGFLKFLKGTPVREKYLDHGFVFDPEPPYQIIESKYLSHKQLQSIVRLEHALEIYWNDKKAVNTLVYVTKKYSSFEFLLGLGAHFESRKDFHKFSLIDLFEILHEFCELQYPTDTILKELVAIDYYLHFKVKPKQLFIEEVSREEKNTLIAKYKLNHHKFRYIILPLNFDFFSLASGLVTMNPGNRLIIEYNGEERAKVLKLNLALSTY